MLHMWRRRQRQKRAGELLRHARHVRHMREDLLSAADLRELDALCARVKDAGAHHDPAAFEPASIALQACTLRLMPPRSNPGLRENLEVLIVAVGVAMACRTYFLQPFKIPTGSMQPTLHGILYEDQAEAGLTDRLPLKLVKWAVTGDWYLEVKTTHSGYVEAMQLDHEDSARVLCRIAGKTYRIPLYLANQMQDGRFIAKGTVLWRGVRKAGDHVFVDRVRWNLFPPKRGQIVVFNTDDIPSLPPKMHYIKRMVGLPNERISISPPELLVNGQPCREPEGIRRIAAREPGYAGYKLVDGLTAGDPHGLEMRTPATVRALGPDEFFALGDNTGNSRDGRYWGTVPRRNLVGPAIMVYWPFSKRWGHPD